MRLPLTRPAGFGGLCPKQPAIPCGVAGNGDPAAYPGREARPHSAQGNNVKTIIGWVRGHLAETILSTLALSLIAFLVYNSVGERGEQHRVFTEKCRVACYPNPVETALVDENRCECNMKRLIKKVQ